MAGLSKELAPPKFNAEASWGKFTELRDIAEKTTQSTIPETRTTEKETKEKTGRVIPFRRFLVPAATLVIAASIALLLVFGLNGGQKEFSTAPGETLALILPDQSEVSLDPDSRLAYNEKTWDQERKIELHGSAYFKVKKGSKFSVESDQGTVQVLGTEFQINDRQAGYQVWCLTGKVAVSFQGRNEKMELTPESGVEWDGKSTPVPIEFEASDFEGMSRNRFNYENTEVSLVIQEMERQFGIEIETPDFSGETSDIGFFRDDLEGSLNLVATKLGMTVEENGPKKYRLVPATP